MASRNIRSRVLAAVLELDAFTVPDLCRAAGLTRTQAYPQLQRLKAQGFLGNEQLQAVSAHRPLTFYKLKPDEAKRWELARELSEYRLPEPQRTSGLAAAALEAAHQTLDRIDRELDAAEGDPQANGERVAILDDAFNSARSDIGTALLESREEHTTRPLAVEERFREVSGRRDRVKEVLERRAQPRLAVADLLRAAADIIGDALSAPEPVIADVGHAALTGIRAIATFSAASRIAREMLVDAIAANPERPFESVFRGACRTGDPKLVEAVLDGMSGLNIPWLRFDLENARYLLTRQLNELTWLAACRGVELDTPTITGQQLAPLGLYSCAVRHLTEGAYEQLTKNRRVSVVSPQQVDFLGPSEQVRPTLLVGSGERLESLDCSFLNPVEKLYAYGPIANQVGHWQGAPPLRVAACLGSWGLPISARLTQITESLRNDRGLLVVQQEQPESIEDLTGHVRSVLETEEICLLSP